MKNLKVVKIAFYAIAALLLSACAVDALMKMEGKNAIGVMTHQEQAQKKLASPIKSFTLDTTKWNGNIHGKGLDKNERRYFNVETKDGKKYVFIYDNANWLDTYKMVD